MSQENASGQPKTGGNANRYKDHNISAVFGARQKLKIKGVEIGNQTPKELATNALTIRSELHRLACVAELLSRLDGPQVRSMLKGLPTVEKKHGKRQSGSNVHETPIAEQNRDQSGDAGG